MARKRKRIVRVLNCEPSRDRHEDWLIDHARGARLLRAAAPPAAKEQAIRELFNLSATHYYQILNALIDTEDALAHDPMLVKRLRRLRTSRQRARTARRLGSDA